MIFIYWKEKNQTKDKVLIRKPSLLYIMPFPLKELQLENLKEIYRKINRRKNILTLTMIMSREFLNLKLMVFK
jgi:hypothetical protein